MSDGLDKPTPDDLRDESRRKIEFMEREYWRVRNGRQRYIRCPYCSPRDGIKHRNYIGSPNMCCTLFAKCLKAILDRQDEVDKAASAAHTIIRIANTETVN
jgi:hypothetical protein